MRKIARKAMTLGLCATLAVTSFAFTGCGQKSSDENTGSDETTAAAEEEADEFDVDHNVTGDISIMLWAGDSKYYEDIGHMGLNGELTKDDISSQNVAAVLAVAMKFNEQYPNVKINLWAKSGDPNQYNTPTWDQEIENFKTSYGKYADIWASTDVPGDIKKGLVADLSSYSEDAGYQRYNQTMMGYLNYYGFQAGLPSYAIPWGVWINKELAETNNIEVPDVDWDIDDYTDFMTSADKETFWGDNSTATILIETGTKDINAMIANYDGGDTFVNINSDAVSNLLEYVPEWAPYTIDSCVGNGEVSQEIVEESGSYSWNYFVNNRLLTLTKDPWQMTNAADPDADDAVKSNDWDIYPRPATEYTDNQTTVGMVIDPICIHNYALDDGKEEWSDEEIAKRDLTYVFAKFWTQSTEAKQAIADQQYKYGRSYKNAMNDSFPVVDATKYPEMYNDQMKIWYSIPAHERYADEDKMPGFQEVVKIFGDPSRTWDYSDKCFPCSIIEGTDTVSCMYEWENMWDGELTGSYMTEPNWVNDVRKQLADWNKNINERFAEANTQLKQALKDYYGFKDDDFNSTSSDSEE